MKTANSVDAKLKRMSTAIAEFKADIATSYLRALIEKYRQEQPRVPRGVPAGGRWTVDTGSHARVAMGRRFRLTPELEQECEDQYTKDTFICTMAGSAGCHAQAAVRYSACRNGKYVPDLNFGGTL